MNLGEKRTGPLSITSVSLAPVGLKRPETSPFHRDGGPVDTHLPERLDCHGIIVGVR